MLAGGGGDVSVSVTRHTSLDDSGREHCSDWLISAAFFSHWCSPIIQSWPRQSQLMAQRASDTGTLISHPAARKREYIPALAHGMLTSCVVDFNSS